MIDLANFWKKLTENNWFKLKNRKSTGAIRSYVVETWNKNAVSALGDIIQSNITIVSTGRCFTMSELRFEVVILWVFEAILTP